MPLDDQIGHSSAQAQNDDRSTVLAELPFDGSSAAATVSDRVLPQHADSADSGTLASVHVDEPMNQNELFKSHDTAQLTAAAAQAAAHQLPPSRQTPLPWKLLSVIYLLFLMDSLNFTSLFPYVSFMVKSFNITDDERKIGYFAGLIATSGYIAQFFSSPIWGYMSDRFGRRPVLLCGMVGSSITILAFGLSKWFWMACLSRLAFGLVNGNLASFKAMLSEVTDNTNQPKAFAYFSITFGIGSILGSIVGGTLSRPVTQYPDLFQNSWMPSFITSFLTTFPFILPNLVSFSLSTIGFVLGLFVLKETNASVKAHKHHEHEAPQPVRTAPSVPTNIDAPVAEADVQQRHQLRYILRHLDDPNLIKWPRWWPKSEMFRSPIPLLACAAYSLVGFIQVCFDETLPVWSQQKVSNGGLGFLEKQVGLMQTLSGICILFFGFFLLHRIIRWFGAIRTMRVGLLLLAPFVAILPSANMLFRLSNLQWLAWIVLTILLVLRQISVSMCFTPINMLVNNSVTSSERGRLNGLSQSGVALSRAIAPVTALPLLSWSLTNGLSFPLNYFLPFLFIAAICVVLLFVTMLFPPSLDMKKKPEEPVSESAPMLEPEDSSTSKEPISIELREKEPVKHAEKGTCSAAAGEASEV